MATIRMRSRRVSIKHKSATGTKKTVRKKKSKKKHD